MLFTINARKLTTSEHNLQYVRHFSGTQEEANASLEGAQFATPCGYDETRAYYSSLRESALNGHIGRLRAIIRNEGVCRSSKKERIASLERAEAELTESLNTIYAKESVDIISYLQTIGQRLKGD